MKKNDDIKKIARLLTEDPDVYSEMEDPLGSADLGLGPGRAGNFPRKRDGRRPTRLTNDPKQVRPGVKIAPQKRPSPVKLQTIETLKQMHKSLGNLDSRFGVKNDPTIRQTYLTALNALKKLIDHPSLKA